MLLLKDSIRAPVAAGRGTRDRIAAAERPLVITGLVLVVVHLLDHAISGPDTTAAGVVAIIAVAALAIALQPHVTRATRVALTVPLGAAILGTGAVAYVLDLFTSGPRWSDVTGIGYTVGGALLIGAGIGALAARPRTRAPTRTRAALHMAAWIAGAFVIGQFAIVPIFSTLITTHAIRVTVNDDDLTISHRTVEIPGAGNTLDAWWVPSRNRAAVLVLHGAGSSRANTTHQIGMLVRAGYGVLALDAPGHGTSDGHAHLLGGGQQPGIRAAIDWLTQRPGVDPRRVGALGLSMGGETALEAAARDRRLRAVVSDGATRPDDLWEVVDASALERASSAVSEQVRRSVSGTREAPALLDLVPRIAPRPVLLIATGKAANEIRVNEAYARAVGPAATVFAIPEAGHMGGDEARPGEYARRVTRFFSAAMR